MSNITRKTLQEMAEFENGQYQCPFCARIYPDLDSLTEHVSIDHNYEISDMEEKLSVIAIENKSALEEWKERKKIEILQNASQTELELYNHDEMALEGRIKDEMWKMAFRQPQRLSTLDTKIMDSLKPESGKCPEGYALVEVEGSKMCIPANILNEVFQKRVSKEGVEQFKSHPESGMTNEFLPMPESPEAKKVLERSSEELSETKKKRELMTVLIALLRDKEKKR